MSKLLSPVITGRVEGGKLVAEDPALFKKAFWVHEGRRVDVIVKRHMDNRSNSQNRYYWGVVVMMIAEAMGEDDLEAAHEVLKLQCNYYITMVKGSEVRVPMSTADLETLPFEDYLERCRKLAATWFDLYIPLPNEVAY